MTTITGVIVTIGIKGIKLDKKHQNNRKESIKVKTYIDSFLQSILENPSMQKREYIEKFV